MNTKSVESIRNLSHAEGQTQTILELNQFKVKERVLRQACVGIAVIIVVGVALRSLVAPLGFGAVAVTMLLSVGLYSVPYCVKKTNSLFLGSSLLIATLGVLALLSAIFNGGVRAPVVGIFALLPLAGFVTYGRKMAKIGLFCGVLCLIGLLLVEQMGGVYPLQSPEKYHYYKAVVLFFLAIGSYFLASVFDHSRQWADNEMLQMSAELVNTTRLAGLGEIAAGIGHEVNNPLAIVLGKLTQLRRKIEGGGSSLEEISGDLAKIEVAATRIEKVVKGLRMLSKNSGIEPSETVRVAALLQSTLELVAERLELAKTKVVVNCDATVEMVCLATQMTQVILNLVINAVDAISALPEKWIRIDVAKFADGANRHWLEIRVIDSGAGIEPAVLTKMMQPFYTTKPVGKGTGLGLSISRRMVESQGGLLFYNPDSANTCFVVRMPTVSS